MFWGLYIILSELGRGTYKLVTEDCKSTVRATGAHLKPYDKSSPVPSLDEQYSYMSELQVYQFTCIFLTVITNNCVFQ